MTLNSNLTLLSGQTQQSLLTLWLTGTLFTDLIFFWNKLLPCGQRKTNSLCMLGKSFSGIWGSAYCHLVVWRTFAVVSCKQTYYLESSGRDGIMIDEGISLVVSSCCPCLDNCENAAELYNCNRREIHVYTLRSACEHELIQIHIYWKVN